MKRALRILVRMMTLPFVIPFFIWVYIISLCFVFQEWLFENADHLYSFKDYHKEVMHDNAKNYILNFFR